MENYIVESHVAYRVSVYPPLSPLPYFFCPQYKSPFFICIRQIKTNILNKYYKWIILTFARIRLRLATRNTHVHTFSMHTDTIEDAFFGFTYVFYTNEMHLFLDLLTFYTRGNAFLFFEVRHLMARRNFS